MKEINQKAREEMRIINLTILECKLKNLKSFIKTKAYNKSNHIGM